MGDILELPMPSGFVYLHYIGRHPEYGDAVMVCPEVYNQRLTNAPWSFPGGYVAFYPVQAAIAQGLVKIVGQMPSPELPKRLRRPGKRSARRIDTWIIEDGEGGEVLRGRLSDVERQIPIAVIWNHDFLIQRILEGWRPELEGN